MNKERIVMVIDSTFTAAQLAEIQRAAERNGARFKAFLSPDEAGEQIRDAEVIFTAGGASGAATAKKADNLKWFASHFAGVDALLAPGVLKNGVMLTNGSGAYGLSISEHLIMVTLMLLRRYPEYNNIVRARSFKSDLGIRSVCGSRITVCGTGDIGTNYAKRLRAFDPESIIGVNRSGRTADGFDKTYPVSELDRLLSGTDILAFMLPGTPETEGILSKKRLSMLPKDAFVINVGRGSAIDQSALIEALNSGRLAGAALDVFAQEPIPEDDPIWDARNIIITPHCSGKLNLSHTVNALVAGFCDNLDRYFNGLPLKHLVDPQIGY